MDENNKGFKKGSMIMVIGCSSHHHDAFRLHELVTRMSHELENAKIAMIRMGEAGIAGAKAGTALTSAIKTLQSVQCPTGMISMDIDFNHCEKFVLDSLTVDSLEPIHFPGFINESAPANLRLCVRNFMNLRPGIYASAPIIMNLRH